MKRVGRHILRSADEYPADEPVIPSDGFSTRLTPRNRDVASDSVAKKFDDDFIRSAELPPGADLDIFAAGVREAARVYATDVLQPDDNKLHHEIKVLYDAVHRRRYEDTASSLEGLSPRAVAYLGDRLKRPGPRRAGLRLPTPEELRDHRQREKACAAIEQLCRIGGIPVEGRERRGGKRSRWTLRPSLHAPELQQHVPKREPERNFVMNLQTTWAEATNTMPPRTARHADPGFAQECLGRLGAEGASVVELINGLRRVTKQRASEGPAQGAKSVSARARTYPTLGASQTRVGAMTRLVTTENKPTVEHKRAVAGTAKREQEREAAINAKATLERLTPFSKRSDRIIFDLRSAANLARTAESTQALNRVRAEAARSLNAVCRLLETAQLTQKALEQTRDAVSAWLTEINAERA